MQKILALAALASALLLVACKGGGVVGKWGIDTNSLPEQVKGNAQALEMLKKVEIEFKADGTTSATGPDGKTETGKYEVKDKTVTVTDAKGTTTSGTLGDDGAISMTNQGLSFKFVRK
jgi:uncharacterized lipoprotein NlpE involved in copper resistance